MWPQPQTAGLGTTNRSFPGMTVHWINLNTLKREKAVLACRELSVSQTSTVLANNITDIHKKFDIEHKFSKNQYEIIT